MALTMDQLNAVYNDMNVYGNTVAPMAVNNPAGLQIINKEEAPMVQPVTQSNGLPYLLNQSGNQNQNFSMEEYEKAIANQNKEPTDNFLTRSLSGIMNNKFVQGARNIGSMIKTPFMGGLSYLASKVDKFDTLPYVDQQYVKQNMGYTGPTIFGENTTGLNTDLYGKNVRSLGLLSDTDGSYGQFQVNEAKKLGENITKRAKEKYGVDFNVDKFLEEGDKYLETLSGEKVDKFKTLNKLNLERLNFYGKGSAAFINQKDNYQKSLEIKETQARQARKEAAERQQAEAASFEQAQRAREAATATRAMANNPQVYRNAGITSGGFASQNTGTNLNFSNKTGKGRTGYGKGGIVSL